MNRRKVTNVDRYYEGGQLWWKVKYEILDVAPGETAVHYHLFPHESLEWRAAEYDLDPSDAEVLLDIVLAEPFIPVDQGGLSILHTAATIAEARTVHLARCAQAKLAMRLSSRGIQNPLEMVRSEFSPRHNRIQEKKSFVREARRELKERNNRG